MMTLDSMVEARALTAGLISPYPCTLIRCYLMGFLISSSLNTYAKSPSLKISLTNWLYVAQQVISKSRN
jgi:hypothetical protein